MRIPKPIRFPKDSGVTMEGFENIMIPSRERVGHQLQVFVDSALNSRSVTVRTILGTWGEGKTETYERFLFSYCKQKNFACFFVSASTIANAYSRSKISSLIESSPVNAIRFTTALLSSIRVEKAKNNSIDPEKVIKNPDTSLKADEFIKKSFEKIKPFRRLFVFIDEFEELLLREELKPIISGIKELINGQFLDVDEGGEFEGLLHLVISCTPEAFYHLRTSGEFEQIFGSFARRQDVIELSQISKSEGMDFLWNLLQYCYDFNLPSAIPISSSGIFEVLLRIGQKNLGVLVSLFSRIMQANFSGERDDLDIDGEFLLEFLKDRVVFVYGGNAKCVEEEIYTDIRNSIQKHAPDEFKQPCWKAMKVLIGEPKPFSYEEISRRIGTSLGKTEETIDILMKITERHFKIKNAIVKVNKLRNNTTKSEIINRLSRFRVKENEKEYIQMDQYAQSLIQFTDSLTFYELTNAGLHPYLFFPHEKKDATVFFPGIRLKTSEEVLRRIENLRETETLFVISEDILSAIYPSPVPMGLEYITDKKERIKIWGEVGKHLNEYYEQYINKAIFSLMNITEKLDFQIDERYGENIAEISAIGIGKVSVLVWTCNGDVTESDIICISDFMRDSEIPIHLVLLFHTGSITNLAKEEMINLGLVEENYSKILDARLYPMFSRRILSHYLSKYEKLSYAMISKKPVIDDEQYKKTAESLFDELKLIYKIAEWEKVQEKRGLIIYDLETEFGTSGSVAGSLKHFLNFPDETDFSNVYRKNQDTVRRFVRYGSRDAPLGDIESEEQLEKLGQDLMKNGMLEKKEGKFLTPLHPVEKRILDILDYHTRMELDELEEFFIRRSKAKRVFGDVFLNNLKIRGKIKIKGKISEKTSLGSILEDLDKRKKNLERIWTKDETIKFGIFYEEKQRDFHTFIVSDFKEFIEELLNFIEKHRLTNEPEIESKLYRKIILSTEIIDHFQEEIFPLFLKASKKAASNKTRLFTMHAPLENNLMKLINLSDEWLAIKIEKNQLEDWKMLEDLKNQIEKITDEEINIITFENFLSDIEEHKNPFFFKNNEEKAFFFNPKLFFLENLMEEYKKEATILQGTIGRIISILEGIENRINQSLSQLRIPETSEKLPLSHKVMKHLKNISLKGDIQEFRAKNMQLGKILESVKNSEKKFNEFFGFYISSIDQFRELVKLENEFRDIYENKRELFFIAKTRMNTLKLQNIFEEEQENFTQIQESYSLLLEYTLPEALSMVPQSIENFREKMGEIIEKTRQSSNRIEFEWETRIESIVDNFEQHILILKALTSKGKAKDINELVPKMRQLRDDIAGKNLQKSPYDMKNIENKIERFLEEFATILGFELDENQKYILLRIIELCKGKGQTFMPLRELYEIAKKKGLDSNQTRDIINSLIRKNLVTVWISLPQDELEN